MVRRARELHPRVVLDPAVTPVSQRVVSAVLAAISDGSLLDDDPLPSSRSFAEEHCISRSSVVQAYETLVGLGVVRSVHGSGTRVSPGARALLDHKNSTPSPAPHRPEPSKALLDLTVPANMHEAVLDPREWNRAWREAISPEASGSGPGELVRALHDHLRSFRGMSFAPEQVVLRPSVGSVVADIVHSAELRGQAVVVEDPGNPRIQRHFIDHGCRVRCVPVDDHGLRIDMLSGADRAVHVTPARQWPTGVSMAEERRQELLDWSVRTGGIIIENDLDAEFVFGRAPEPTLFAMAPPGARVLYLGSPAKLLSPELAVVWLIVDPSFRRRASDLAPVSDFPARALAHFITSGALYRHRNRALSLCRERRDALIKALARTVPAVRTLGDPSGTEILLQLPDGADELSVQMRLEQDGFQVSALGDFAIRPRHHALLLHYGALTPSAARGFARCLHQALLADHPRQSAS
ncbi:PLP-dependent aminotransferase family protein [Arachnia propionica]|uniref:PLP-dependent aminotransferase family protein n=1 Tax=Arachnia propionica TaxID=1750 RepID=A0A3P1WUM0_9ACTN|nr:PLP-dependent aminotransferase family protein [Arachnia propionica]RRD49608.1 PLP-dependent aminotransferase family protein [Arachnia propionica]